jgi:hypothetical protein
MGGRGEREGGCGQKQATGALHGKSSSIGLLWSEAYNQKPDRESRKSIRVGAAWCTYTVPLPPLSEFWK